ncbi:MAG: hypothetical protein F6K48_10940 [Okeania sp. SIO3H1]|nr:hypothetical protein [Okeania sp. SIO3H1]
MINWRPYLESICRDYAKWWEVYTLTDVRGKKSLEQRQHISPLLDLGLMVQTVESEEKQRERPEEKIERLTVLEGLRKYAPNHVLLVGRPGSGKSTALARLLLEEATKLISPLSPKEESPLSPPLERGEIREGEIRRETPPLQRGVGGDKSKIPILIELRYSQSSILSRIQAFIHKHHPTINIDTATLETLLRQGQFLLLFDGFNEMASEAARQEVRMFRQDYPQTAMVFTTRDLSLGGDLGIEKRLEMQPLTESQMQEFVCAYLREHGEKLWQQLQGRLRELGETPMFLWMLCDVFAHNNVVPANLGLVFRLFTQIYSIRLKQDVPVDENSRRWWDRLLQELAWVMSNGESKTEIMVAISRQKAEAVLTEFLQGKVEAPDDRAMCWLEDLLEHHLIQVGDDGQISFRHQLLQEYYVAERLLWQLSGLSDYELQWDYLNYLKWTEVVALMLGLVEDEGLAVRVVRLALEVDWFLGARLVGEVQRRFQEQAFVEIERCEFRVFLMVELAGLTNSDVTVPGLVKFLEYSDSDVRRNAAQVLGKIGSETATPRLIPLLEDSDSCVRRNVAKALGKIGSETAIEGLITPLLEDLNSGVRTSAAEALGKIGSETAIPGLIILLEDLNSDVRTSAAEALGKIGSETAIEGLIPLLEDSNSDVRTSAAEALGKIGSETAIEGFPLLEDSNSDVRTSAAEALGKIGSETAIEGLIPLLEDSNFYVRRSIADALSTIATVSEKLETAIKWLILLLEDSNSDVRKNAADALGKICSKTAIEGLMPILSKTAIEGLIPLLENSDSYFRLIAANALGKIGTVSYFSETVIERLIPLLEDSYFYVRTSAANALGKIGTVSYFSETVIERLIPLLEDSYSNVRVSAVKALGKVGSENTIVELTKKLQQIDKKLLSLTIKAIQTIQQRLQYYKPIPKIPMSNTLSHNYALLIGVGDCKYPNWSLPVTVKDVQAIKSFLINPDLCGYIDNENYLRFLCNEQATKQNILDNLNWLQQQAKNDPEATILVYYSGHGWLDNSTQNYYLISHDTSPVKLQKTALPATEFNNALQQISAQKLLVIIDSCHAQGMANAKETEELELPENFSQTALPKKLIDELRKGRGRAVFTSSTGEESSWIRSDGKMSIYTDHFLEALNGANNKPGDKFVTVSNLMNYVGKTVPESAKQLGEKQTPIFDFSQTEDFPVALLCGGKGLPDGGWEEVKSEVRENISVRRDVNSAGGDNTSQINVFGSSETTITIGDIGSKRSQ